MSMAIFLCPHFNCPRASVSINRHIHLTATSTVLCLFEVTAIFVLFVPKTMTLNIHRTAASPFNVVKGRT